MPQSKRRYHRSFGEMISTFAYVVAALWLLSMASGHLDDGNNLRGYGTMVCGLLCLLGTIRFQIHNFFARLKDMRK
tara:strand:+ start:844 stop:1071 length:228 start_codon:yes stop_codon:yes gene_type:complete